MPRVPANYAQAVPRRQLLWVAVAAACGLAVLQAAFIQTVLRPAYDLGFGRTALRVLPVWLGWAGVALACHAVLRQARWAWPVRAALVVGVSLAYQAGFTAYGQAFAQAGFTWDAWGQRLQQSLAITYPRHLAGTAQCAALVLGWGAYRRHRSRAGHPAPAAPTSAATAAAASGELKLPGPHLPLSWDAILYLQGAGAYVEIVTAARTFTVSGSLKTWQAQLPADTFVRVHRSWVVHRDAVVQMLPLPNGEYRLRMRNGAELRLSRSYKPAARHLPARHIVPTA